ncbi:hypothetical protein EK21DRAFT_109841 [Setomelanomma holmii]|uniref:Uncharacterized protein n=1 Tax=Setomelanomma holmii TaxID=210430 RepID=A0A9P4HDX9_9PLEO|nr:hypothetical protein EK21DRAFT_109841 [Setomelanomma holmii]
MTSYEEFQQDIHAQIMRVSWCYSSYYTFLAYVILLDCDDHRALEMVVHNLRMAGHEFRSVYHSIQTPQIETLAATVSSMATRHENLKTVSDLFAGRYLLWTDGGFRGINCPGTEVCCDDKICVVIANGLSFPLLVRDWDETTGEGWIAGFANIRGVDMLGQDADKASLTDDYKKGEIRVLRLR